MEETTKYGSSTVLLTNVAAGKEKSNELEEFPCISPIDDGKFNLICWSKPANRQTIGRYLEIIAAP